MLTDQQKTDLLNKVSPLKLVDGKDVFKKYMDEYVVHEKGLFILAPSGIGKTHFINNQSEKHWIDGDEIWTAAGAHPKTAWWTMGTEYTNEIDMRSDLITLYIKKLGLWVMGACHSWLKPDAIVLPDWETHKQYIVHREQNNYDGGATSKDFDQVLGHREYMEQVAKRDDVPIFHSLEEAVAVLTKDIG